MASETGILGGALPFAADAQVTVLGASVEGLLAGAPAQIGLHKQGRLGDLWVHEPGAEPGKVSRQERSWTGAMADWWASEGVVLQRWDGNPEGLEAPLMITGGADLLEGPPPLLSALNAVDPDAVVAIAGLGAEAGRGRNPERARQQLVDIAAGGGLLHAEAVMRYGPAGRGFVELIEHLNHRSGPDGQSLVGDTIRAALFGRYGEVPVNLASREQPPEIDLSTLFVHFVALHELV